MLNVESSLVILFVDIRRSFERERHYHRAISSTPLDHLGKEIYHVNCMIPASPASGKLGMRMTTLHEEPGSMSGVGIGATNKRRARGEDHDKEDTHSDPESDHVGSKVQKSTFNYICVQRMYI